jgi:hypothetical protein
VVCGRQLFARRTAALDAGFKLGIHPQNVLHDPPADHRMQVFNKFPT